MNLSAFLIFNLSVHHLKLLEGAGYPKPKRQTQKESLVRGLTRFVEIGRFCSFAAFSILDNVSVICSTIFGDSTRVSEEII